MENGKICRQEILTDQSSLLKIEKELKEMISKVNEQINTLKVEELQLKANIFSDESTFKTEIDSREPKYKLIEIPEFINSQTLDLNVNKFGVNKFNEEYDSE